MGEVKPRSVDLPGGGSNLQPQGCWEVKTLRLGYRTLMRDWQTVSTEESL